MEDPQEFGKLADRFMHTVLDALDEFDPDEVDANLAMGVLTMEFADGSRCIMNRQTAAHQIWLAYGAQAWHFDRGPDGDGWVDTKGRGKLEVVLAEVLGGKLGRPVQL